MKYITESELRDLYRAQPFEVFSLKENTKLTPGGRQFLTDRKISIITEQDRHRNRRASVFDDGIEVETVPSDHMDGTADVCLEAHFALLEAIFLKQVMEVLEWNPALANQIYEMKCTLETISCRGENQITDRHTQPAVRACSVDAETIAHFRLGREVIFEKNGKEISLLYLLRCELHKFYLDEVQVLTEVQKEDLTHLMNRLSKMICNFSTPKRDNKQDSHFDRNEVEYDE